MSQRILFIEVYSFCNVFVNFCYEFKMNMFPIAKIRFVFDKCKII